MLLALRSHWSPFAKPAGRQREVDCGNMHDGVMHVPPSGVATTLNIFGSHTDCFSSWGGRLYVFEAPCSLQLQLTGLTEELLLHVSRAVLARFDGHGDRLSRLHKYNNFAPNSRGPCGCNVLTYRAVVDPIVNLSEETLTQDLAHCDVPSGNAVFFWSELKGMFFF